MQQLRSSRRRVLPERATEGARYPGQLRKSPRREQGPESQCRDYNGSLQHLRQSEERASRRVLLWLQSGPRVSSQDQWRNFPSFIRPSGFPSSTREGRGKERRERKRESAECSSAVATVPSVTTSTRDAAECFRAGIPDIRAGQQRPYPSCSGNGARRL